MLGASNDLIITKSGGKYNFIKSAYVHKSLKKYNNWGLSLSPKCHKKRPNKDESRV